MRDAGERNRHHAVNLPGRLSALGAGHASGAAQPANASTARALRVWVLCLGSFVGATARADTPTWSRDVAPILYQNCVECHRPGQVAPFSLLTFTDAAKRARFIARATESRFMPPWLPDSPRETFHGERHLTDAQITTLRAWAEGGAPAGDPATAPSPPTFAPDGWRLGPPDLVVRMKKPFPIPPGPGDIYQVFPLPLDLAALTPEVRAAAQIPGTNLLGVSAIEVHAGNRRALHHAILFADTSGVARQREAAEGGNGYTSFGNPGFETAGFLGGHVPGTVPRPLPDGIAEALPFPADLALQVHYSPTGKAETDQTEVGLYFVREPVRRLVEWLRLGSFNIEIPAGATHHVIEDTLEIPADCFVLSISPHMHLLGRESHTTAQLPDGTTRELLTIRRWDFAWQDRYAYRKPVYLPRGTVVRTRWVFDNSDANPRNPHSPARPVHFGPNTSDEMCELHLFVVPEHLEDYPRFSALMARVMAAKIAELTPDQRRRYGFTP